ncbi:MAG: class I SAM-dependent methyltransferase [Oscillospiraceae bacterium]
MIKQDVIEFFDRLAPDWDAEMIRDDEIIRTILDNAGVKEGVSVLDVACGTGVLIPDYQKCGVSMVTGVDISPNMIAIAREKFPQPNVRFLCSDIEEAAFETPFDCIVVYNAFPHFPDPAKLIGVLAHDLRTGGTLTVAHGMSRAKIDHRHEGSARKVSAGLMHEDALEMLFKPYFDVTVKISDDRMYQVVGVKR